MLETMSIFRTSFFKIIKLLIVLICAGFCVFLITFSMVNRHPEILVPPLNIFDKTLILAVDKDYPPYSFFTGRGLYSGHDIELFYYLCNKLKFNAEVRMMNWSDAKKSLQNGTVDLLMGMTYSTERLTDYDFSIPLTNTPYVAFSKNKDITMQAIQNARICTIAGDGIQEAFIIPYKLTDRTTYYNTFTEAFLSVGSGKNEYVIAPYIIGKRIIAAQKLKNIKTSSFVLDNSIYCIAVKKGNTELLTLVNQGISALTTEKTIDFLQNKWLKTYIEIINFGDFLHLHRTTILIYLCITFCVGFILILFAYTARKNTEQQAMLNEKYFNILIQKTKKITLEWDFSRKRISQVSNFKEIFGRGIAVHNVSNSAIIEQMIYSDDIAVFNHVFQNIINGEHNSATRFRIKDENGTTKWCTLSGVTVKDNNEKPLKSICLLENIDEQVRTEETLRKSAAIDNLTGLYNKISLQHLIESTLKTEPKENISAFICTDLDNFKKINDNFGHMFGDDVLIEVSRKFRSQFRSTDILGRFGGDEFVFFIHRIPDKKFIKEKASILNKNIFMSYSGEADTYTVTASIGIALFPLDGVTYNELYKKADEASYQAKKSGKNCYRFYGDY